jgi:predicted O-methyltransferase YrrM
MTDWIAQLFADQDLTRMGHCQRVADRNLGLGWLYYALARVLRPATVVVIGSFRGFVPLVFGKALADNSETGNVCFIDPSLVDNYWKDPAVVKRRFAGLGVTNIRHYLMTTQEFVESEGYRALGPVGIVFVDGYHSAEQARFDYEAFQSHLTPDGLVLFHDSLSLKTTRLYGPARAYQHQVKDFLDTLKKRADLQVFDFPFGQGVTLVRKVQPAVEERPH